MARGQLTDYLLNSRFHVLDVSLAIPPVLIPIFGFSGCTAPELSIQYREIKEGNYEFPRKVAERASVSAITLTNGSGIFNSDFYDWIRKKPDGRVGKKNLMLIHFSNMGIGSDPNASFSIGPIAQIEFALRVPAKAWVLKDCNPGRYKSGTDFESSGGTISLQELEIEYEEFTEFNVGI